METPRKRIKAKLKNRELLIGVNPQFASSGLTEFIASQGVELIFIDCEHGGPDIERVSDMARAARACGAASVIRPWSTDPRLLRRYIGCGVDGFIVPDVESAADILKVVSVIESADPPDSHNMIVIGLIESKAGMSNLGEIVVCPSVDALLVGPGDLAVSLGLSRRKLHEEVKQFSFDVLRMAHAAGKSAGAPIEFGVGETIAAGANVIMYFFKDITRAALSRVMLEAKKESD